MSGRIHLGFVGFIAFYQRSSGFVASWRGRFWCETGAVRERSLYEISIQYLKLFRLATGAGVRFVSSFARVVSNSLPNAVAPHCNCERGLRSTAGPSILRACRSTRPSRRRVNRLGGSSSASSLRLEFVTKLVAARAPPSPAFEGYG